ncbi:MAG TPA: hypothetical protein VGF94_28415 [Kofleriaceae bacterium]|jgi:hypothetical protein
MRLTIALTMLPALALAGPHKYDVSDDAKLDKAVQAELHHAADHNCTERMTGDFKKVVLVGSFANDRGCMAEGYFADGVYVADRGKSAPALAASGWSDAKKRGDLAVAWAKEMTGDSFAGDPKAVAGKDGSVVVTGWVNDPVGMIPEQHSEQLEFRFTPAGDVTTKVLAQKTTKLH